MNWWIYIICLDSLSGCNPQQLQRSRPCLHQPGASLVHIIFSWINADVSFVQNLQSFRLPLLNKETSPQVWIWQHCTALLSEKGHRFGSECCIFWAFGKNKCSYVLLYENSSKAENKEMKRRLYGTRNREIWQDNVRTWNFTNCFPPFDQKYSWVTSSSTDSTGILRMLHFTQGQLNFLQVCVQFIYTHHRKSVSSWRCYHYLMTDSIITFWLVVNSSSNLPEVSVRAHKM